MIGFKVDNTVLQEDKRILVAVSGGVDSMVLAFLLSKKYVPILAHINHQKRGEESNKDEELVRQFAIKNGLEFVSTILPKEFNQSKNFQENARLFRYQWLIEQAKVRCIRYIATAHHADDIVETFLGNLMKGTGLNGLTGITSKIMDDIYILRPLLKVTKEEIIQFAEENQIPYRNDLSNFENNYTRNKIRNILVPQMVNINDRANQNILNTIDRLQQTNDHYLSLVKEKLGIDKGELPIDISLNKIISDTYPALLLYSFVSHYGFNLEQCNDLLASITSGSAKIISGELEIVRDRETVIVKKIADSKGFYCEILKDGTYEINNQVFNFKTIQGSNLRSNDKSKFVIPFSEEAYPLVVRSRRDGDKFSPNGMNGLKKTLKKFIIDSKLNPLQKEEICVVEKNNKVVLVSPFRAAHFNVENDSIITYLEISVKTK